MQSTSSQTSQPLRRSPRQLRRRMVSSTPEPPSQSSAVSSQRALGESSHQALQQSSEGETTSRFVDDQDLMLPKELYQKMDHSITELLMETPASQFKQSADAVSSPRVRRPTRTYTRSKRRDTTTKLSVTPEKQQRGLPYTRPNSAEKASIARDKAPASPSSLTRSTESLDDYQLEEEPVVSL
jgi:hypothetical protein